MAHKMKLLTIILAMLLLVAGCDLNKKIGESITEGLLEKIGGEDLDIDIDGDDFSFTTEEGKTTFTDDGFTFEGEDGDTTWQAGGEYEWPKGKAADMLPKTKNGILSYVLNSEKTCMLIVDDIGAEDYTEYVKELKSRDFTNDAYEGNSEGMSIYVGNSDKATASISYFSEEKSMQITLEITE